MKKARLVVREQIISPDLKNELNDEGLKALDGIYYSPLEEFEDDVHETDVANCLADKYEKEYEHLRGCKIEVEFV